MNEILEALQGVVLTEPDPEVQPNPAQPDDVAIETQLTQEISVLWSDHLRLSANHKTTAKELRLLRTRLADRLYAIKSHLCRPELGRASQWRGWLRQQGIPRSTAVAGEVPGTASTGNPVQHPSGEALAATEEPRNETAVTPIEEGLPVTREEASAGVAA